MAAIWYISTYKWIQKECFSWRRERLIRRFDLYPEWRPYCSGLPGKSNVNPNLIQFRYRFTISISAEHNLIFWWFYNYWSPLDFWWLVLSPSYLWTGDRFLSSWLQHFLTLIIPPSLNLIFLLIMITNDYNLSSP